MRKDKEQEINVPVSVLLHLRLSSSLILVPVPLLWKERRKGGGGKNRCAQKAYRRALWQCQDVRTAAADTYSGAKRPAYHGALPSPRAGVRAAAALRLEGGCVRVESMVSYLVQTARGGQPPHLQRGLAQPWCCGATDHC